MAARYRGGIINFAPSIMERCAESRYRTNDVKIETNCGPARPPLKGARRDDASPSPRPRKPTRYARGTANLMIYVAHATSAAISNLVLYDRRVSRYTRMYMRVCTHVYTCTRAYTHTLTSMQRLCACTNTRVTRATDYPPLT